MPLPTKTAMRRLQLAEHQTQEDVRLTSRQLHYLQRSAESVDVSPASSDGLWNLRPNSKVGVIRLPDLTVEIRPKLPIDRVLFLASYALGAFQLKPEVTDIDRSADLVEAMVQLFHQAVRRATGRGLLQGYQTREETLNVVRGRIRIEEQLRRRFGIAVPIEVRYDEFTPDIEPNRLLKAAVRRLAWLPQRSPNTRRLLSAMRAVFANVSKVEYRPTHLPEVPVTPLNAHYQPALALARLILQSGAVELAAGKVQSASFLIDMNKVFEDFVAVALREALDLTEHTFPQEARGRDLWLDQGRDLRLKPDISWWQANRCVFVGDAKYKRTTVHGAQNHDIYQALAYALAAGLPSALLIYAHDDQDRVEPVVYEIREARKCIEIAVLDLRGQPDEILERVNRLARKVR
ncbi:MAG: restriction endonuclease [Chloroflexi bacterium]|nr:restriction endonuclease [Chloroflexota bacterium]